MLAKASHALAFDFATFPASLETRNSVQVDGFIRPRIQSNGLDYMTRERVVRRGKDRNIQLAKQSPHMMLTQHQNRAINYINLHPGHLLKALRPAVALLRWQGYIKRNLMTRHVLVRGASSPAPVGASIDAVSVWAS